MFLFLLTTILVILYLAICIAFIVLPLLALWDNHNQHKSQGDTAFVAPIIVTLGILGILLALAVYTGELSISRDGYTPTQGCWSVTTTKELVGKTMTDVRHWESISCP